MENWRQHLPIITKRRFSFELQLHHLQMGFYHSVLSYNCNQSLQQFNGISMSYLLCHEFHASLFRNVWYRLHANGSYCFFACSFQNVEQRGVYIFGRIYQFRILSTKKYGLLIQKQSLKPFRYFLSFGDFNLYFLYVNSLRKLFPYCDLHILYHSRLILKSSVTI